MLIARFVNHVFRHRWCASILLVIAVDVCTYMAFSRRQPISLEIDNGDKVMHLMAFTILFINGHLAIHFDLVPKMKRLSKVVLTANWAFWLSYGVFIELGQHYFAGREASLADLLADVAGLTLGTIIVLAFRIAPLPPQSTKSVTNA